MSRIAPILLVEDEPIVRAMLAGMLRSSGLEVIEAADGHEALEAVAREHPALVVLDLGLPGLDGFEVCAGMRAMPCAAETPVLVLTGREDMAAISRAFEVGANDFAVKSIAPSLLTHRVRFMLRAHDTLTQLRRSETRLAEAQRIAHVGNWEYDVRSGAFIGSAEAFRQLGIGTTASVCPIARVRLAIAEDERESFDRVLRRRSATGNEAGRFEQEFRLADDRAPRRVIQMNGEEELGNEGGIVRVFGTVQDLTEMVASREQIRALAYYDSLTGLPNRLLFVDQLRGAISLARRHGGRLALMVLDLDNFKRINDTLGHGAGDDVLRVIGGRLRQAVRDYDGLLREAGSSAESSVARMGGDEFLLAVVDLAEGEEAAIVARRLIDAMQAPVESSAGPIHVSASVGIAVYPEDGETFETLLKHADVALYQAKDAGRNAYEFYDRRMSEASLQRLVLESSLRTAITERELSVAIQPKVDGRTGEVIGGEALVRWRHKEHGVVAPAIFVTLAERIGLATPLTCFVVEEVSRLFEAWRNEGLVALPISINLSPQLFRDREAIIEAAAIPKRYGVSPELIEFEVTETALIDDPKRADDVLAYLRNEGYRISLDDFGTGFSSLSHLRRFALDSIKIDRDFVRDLPTNARDASITGSIISLASSLGLVAVAEGVENDAQRCVLLSLGCTTMQGYFFGKPEPAGEFTAVLRQQELVRPSK